MPRAANQYNGSLIRPALCPNSNKAAVLNLEKLIEGRPSICADTVCEQFGPKGISMRSEPVRT